MPTSSPAAWSVGKGCGERVRWRVVIGLVLLPSVALALPGPEVVLPVAAGIAQVIVVLGWWGRRQLRRLLLHPLGLAAAVLLGLFVLGPMGAAGIWILARVRRWLVPLVVLLSVDVLGGLALSQPSEALPMLSDVGLVVGGPHADARLAVLRDGPTAVVQVGEAGDFANCWLPGAPVVRPPDLAAHLPGLLEQANGVPVVLLARSLGPPEGTLRQSMPDGVVVAVSGQAFPGGGRGAMDCYAPPLPSLPGKLFTYALSDGPAAPVSVPVPVLRPVDAARLSPPTVSAREILATPTHQLTGEGPVVVVGEDVAMAAAAAGLLGERAVAVVIGPPQTEPVMPRWPVLAVVLLGGLVGPLTRRGARERLLGQIRGAGQTSPAVVLSGVLGWLGIGIAGVGLSQASLPLSMAWLVAPTSVGLAALPGMGLGVAAAVLGWWSVLTRLPPVARPVWGGLWAGLGLLLGSGLISGPLPASVDLLVVGLFWLLAAGVDVGLERRPVWLDRAVSGGGPKADRLSVLARAGVRVPPGVVVWSADEARGAILMLGAPPWIVRSSASDEDQLTVTRAGVHASVVVEAVDGLEAAVSRVTRDYPGEGPHPVLVMPMIDADESGVCQAPVSGRRLVMVESGAGSMAVTGGRVAARQLIDPDHTSSPLLMLSGRQFTPTYLEWLRKDGREWVVQIRPAPVPVVLDTAVLTELDRVRASLGHWRQHPGTLLRRVPAEGLPRCVSLPTAALWSGVWSRDGALGQACAWMGIPRWVLPRSVVLHGWGALWVIEPAWRLLDGLIRARMRLGIPVWPALTTTPTDPHAAIEMLAARSIFLRLIRPYLPVGGTAGRSRSMMLSDALREGRAAADFPHRAPHDLDPNSPRFGVPTVPPMLPPPPLAWDQATADFWRDALRDGMAAAIADLGAGPDNPPPRGLPDTLTAATLPTACLPDAGAGSSRGLWVSGSGPVSGRLVSEPETADADCIVVVSSVTPALMARLGTVAAVVAAEGGLLSHGALLCREAVIPAVFGLTVPTERMGQRVVVGQDGRLVPE